MKNTHLVLLTNSIVSPHALQLSLPSAIPTLELGLDHMNAWSRPHLCIPLPRPRIDTHAAPSRHPDKQRKNKNETRKKQKNLSAGKLPQFELLNLDFGRLLALANGTSKVVVCQTRGLHLRCSPPSASQVPVSVFGLGCTYALRNATWVPCSATCPGLDGCQRSGRSTCINVSLYIRVCPCI